MDIDKFQAYVKDAVKESIAKGEMFSAWDITKKVRETVKMVFPHKVNVPHHFVKAEISKLWQEDSFASMLPEIERGSSAAEDYVKTVIELTNGKKTMLYHSVTSDPETYHAALVPTAAVDGAGNPDSD
jgi:hypothetical protein